MKKHNIIKKLIAGLCIVTLLTGIGTTAFAGSIMDVLKHAGNAFLLGRKTFQQGLGDAFDYIFTKDDAETAFKTTTENLIIVNQQCSEAIKSGKQIKQDAEDVYEGGKKMIEGAEKFLKNCTPEDLNGVVHGEGLKTEGAKEAADRFAEGYKQADNDLVLDVVSLCPGGAPIAAGAKVIKTGVEYSVGYIDAETAETKMTEAAIDLATSAVGGAVAGAVEGTVEKAVVTAVQKGVNTTLKKIAA